MASYGELLHSLTTASINSILRERGFTTWAYYVDVDNGQAGVAFANDTSVGLYRAADTNRLALAAFGIVPIADVRYQSDEHELAVCYKDKPDEWFGVRMFTDASLITDDEEILPRMDDTLTDEWRQFLIDHGMKPAAGNSANVMKVVAVVAVVAVVLAVIWFTRNR